ncbi:MAG: DUF1003 domain-containing protein, partial [Proteobacteria bacterium]|nr:DUF1003 domain-containing protein [Pseudomonadota bacterium]
FLIAKTLVVACWITANMIGIWSFDLYPFILLNLAFSLQAAYVAPLPATPTPPRRAGGGGLMLDPDATNAGHCWVAVSARHRMCRHHPGSFPCARPGPSHSHPQMEFDMSPACGYRVDVSG